MGETVSILVGMGGWDLFPFAGVFYPPDARRGFRKLEFYSRFFDLVEINSTFYNTSFRPDQIRRWITDVSLNPEFVFTVKLFKGFTHTYDADKRDISNVRRLLDTLAGDNLLGGLLIQFPVSFTNSEDRRAYLLSLCGAFRAYRMFVELRHASWQVQAVHRLLTENGAAPVNVDLPKIKRHVRLTAEAHAGVAYFRLMGRNARTWNSPWRIEEDGKHLISDRYHYLYSENELEELARTIRGVRPAPATTFVVFHNDPNAHSLVNGFQLRHKLTPGKKTRIPARLLEQFPQLQSAGKPYHGEDSLFDRA